MKVINKYRYEGRCGGLEVCDAGGVFSVFGEHALPLCPL